MSEWWKTAKDILRGKAKGSKLIVLGVFLVSIGVMIQIYIHESSGMIFWILGIIAFMRGVYLYEDEARSELRRKEK